MSVSDAMGDVHGVGNALARGGHAGRNAGLEPHAQMVASNPIQERGLMCGSSLQRESTQTGWNQGLVRSKDRMLTAVNRDLLLSEHSIKFTIQRLQIVPKRGRLTECRDQLTESLLPLPLTARCY